MIMKIGVAEECEQEALELEAWFREQGTSAQWQLVGVWGGPGFPVDGSKSKFSFTVTSVEIAETPWHEGASRLVASCQQPGESGSGGEQAVRCKPGRWYLRWRYSGITRSDKEQQQ